MKDATSRKAGLKGRQGREAPNVRRGTTPCGGGVRWQILGSCAPIFVNYGRGAPMAGHIEQRTVRRAAVVLRNADHYSREEFDAALAAARRAILRSLQEIGADVDAAHPLIEALDVAISQNRN